MIINIVLKYTFNHKVTSTNIHRNVYNRNLVIVVLIRVMTTVMAIMNTPNANEASNTCYKVPQTVFNEKSKNHTELQSVVTAASPPLASVY